jgi:hypothetical protein
MANNCIGCFPTGRELQAQYEQVRRNAIKYSEENNTPVAIYKDFDGYAIIDADTAINNNYPIKEIVTYTV